MEVPLARAHEACNSTTTLYKSATGGTQLREYFCVQECMCLLSNVENSFPCETVASILRICSVCRECRKLKVSTRSEYFMLKIIFSFVNAI